MVREPTCANTLLASSWLSCLGSPVPEPAAAGACDCSLSSQPHSSNPPSRSKHRRGKHSKTVGSNATNGHAGPLGTPARICVWGDDVMLTPDYYETVSAASWGQSRIVDLGFLHGRIAVPSRDG